MMLLRLFKNDFIHGKMNNIVMLLFIILSAMLSCSSISLLYSSTHQISYFVEDMGKVADLNFTMMNTSEEDENRIHAFFKEKNIRDYQIEKNINLPITNMEFVGHKDIASAGCFATTLPKKYNLIYDEQNRRPDIQKGEVGIPLSMKEQLTLSLGDIVKIKRGDQVFQYKIVSFLRDTLYGSEMMGQKRLLFHQADFQAQSLATGQDEHALVVSVASKKQRENLEFEMQKANLPNYILVTKDTAMLSFLGVQAGSSAIMMTSGIILLCIGFLIIRFTILYQIEENYTEIGIMKAIGLSHTQIKPLYLAKYLGLAVMGSIVGFFASIPFCNMLEAMQSGIVPALPTHVGTYLSSLIIPFMVMLVFIITTIVLRRIKKQSAMDAIRRGNAGETYKAHASISLSKCRRISIASYLAGNDILAHIKNALFIIGVYAFSLLLILIPLMLKDTFTEGAFLEVLGLSKGDLYTQQNGGSSIERLKEDQATLRRDLKKYDKDVKVNVETMSSAVLSDQGVNTSGFLLKRAAGVADVIFDQGSGPKLANEIAISTVLAEKYGKTTGDSIMISMEGMKKSYLITGIYSSMMNLGNNMMAGKDLNYQYAYTAYLVVNFSGNDAKRAQLIDRVQKEYSTMKLITTKDMIVTFSGDMATQIGTISDLMSVIFLVIVFALTILFSKMQIIKSKKAITILQGLGYHMRDIRKWQMRKCVVQAIISILLGMLLHSLISARLLALFFETIGMGNIRLTANVWNSYAIYPLCFLLVIISAQYIVNRTIFRWNVKDLSGD